MTSLSIEIIGKANLVSKNALNSFKKSMKKLYKEFLLKSALEEDESLNVITESFIPSLEGWSGEKSGYIFKNDSKGLGYYKDIHLISKLKTDDNELKFLEEIEKNKEQFSKYIKDEYLFTAVKKAENSYKITIVDDEVKKADRKKIEMEQNKRKMLKSKLSALKDRRNNVFGKKINNLKKSHDNKLLEKYIAAKKENFKFRPNKDGTITVSGNKPLEIPDPNEVQKDTDKWREEFGEFKETVDVMEKSSDYFKSTAYYKYITAILETI